MNLPELYNFPQTYQRDGMQPIILKLQDADTGEYIDLTGHSVLMQLRLSGTIYWEFGTGQTANTQVIVNGTEIQFPLINSWTCPPGSYKYDLQTTSPSGFVRTWIKGSFSIQADISHA